jgi:hypothetical protein
MRAAWKSVALAFLLFLPQAQGKHAPTSRPDRRRVVQHPYIRACSVIKAHDEIGGVKVLVIGQKFSLKAEAVGKPDMLGTLRLEEEEKGEELCNEYVWWDSLPE